MEIYKVFGGVSNPVTKSVLKKKARVLRMGFFYLAFRKTSNIDCVNALTVVNHRVTRAPRSGDVYE